ncbi:MAG: Lrp/AsnC family transcriptional regulator [Saprospiraceae bacterium]|nr:Lrp/AsnC family transcriptional regulator [Saprospiraceae bacterium]
MISLNMDKEVAAQLNMTTTPVYERIKRMEEDGYIRKYVALADKDKLGLSLLAFCNVSLKEHARDALLNFEEQVRDLPEVIECYHIAGLFDYLLKVVVTDMAAYQHFIVNKLAAFDNIGNVQSMFVMTEIKYSTRLPV